MSSPVRFLFIFLKKWFPCCSLNFRLNPYSPPLAWNGMSKNYNIIVLLLLSTLYTVLKHIAWYCCHLRQAQSVSDLSKIGRTEWDRLIYWPQPRNIFLRISVSSCQYNALHYTDISWARKSRNFTAGLYYNHGTCQWRMLPSLTNYHLVLLTLQIGIFVKRLS